MTKDVLITISGIQTIDGEVNDPIETVTPGEYYFRNGKHYILYDEVQEGVPGVTKCMIKIGEVFRKIKRPVLLIRHRMEA